MASIPLEPTAIYYEELPPRVASRFRHIVQLLRYGKESPRDNKYYDSGWFPAIIEEMEQVLLDYPDIICTVIGPEGLSLLHIATFLENYRRLHKDKGRRWNNLFIEIITKNPHALLWETWKINSWGYYGDLLQTPLDKIVRYVEPVLDPLWDLILKKYDWLFALKDARKGQVHFKLLEQSLTGYLRFFTSQGYPRLPLFVVRNLYRHNPELLLGVNAEGKTVFHEFLCHDQSDDGIRLQDRLLDRDVPNTFRYLASKCSPNFLATRDREGKTPLHHVCAFISENYDLEDDEAIVVSEIANFLVLRCPLAILVEDNMRHSPLDYLINATESGSGDLLIARSLAVTMLKQFYSREIAVHLKATSSNLVKEVAQWLLPRVHLKSPIGSKSFIWQVNKLLRRQYVIKQEFQCTKRILDAAPDNDESEGEFMFSHLWLGSSINLVGDAYISWAKTRFLSLQKIQKSLRLNTLLELEILKREQFADDIGHRSPETMLVLLNRPLHWSRALPLSTNKYDRALPPTLFLQPQLFLLTTTHSFNANQNESTFFSSIMSQRK